MTTARDVIDRIGDLIDYLAANPEECKDADWRAWRQLLIYAPKHPELAALLNPWRPKWRHKKRGSEYVVVGEAELQCAQDVIEGRELVIYQAKDGKLWARPPEEFYDGRFEPLPAPPSEERKP